MKKRERDVTLNKLNQKKESDVKNYWARCALSGILLILSTGCVKGPDLKLPATPHPTNYTGTSPAPETMPGDRPPVNPQHLVSGASVDIAWWHKFSSPKLDKLIEHAFKTSPTLASARAALQQAREIYGAQAGTIKYPQVDASLGAQRQRLNPGIFGQTGDAREFSLYNADIGVRYNLDLSGGNHRALEALATHVDYQRYELDAAYLTLAGNIAVTAISQARISAELNATQAILHAQEERLGLDRERLKLGQASQDEILLMQTQLERTRAGLSQLRKQYQQNRHLLALLSGRSPGADGVPTFTFRDFTLPADLPLIVPSKLARHRPDILAAEALLQSANAEYGVAIAKLYPQINLSGNLGSQALTAGALFGTGSAVWSLLGQLVQPLFHPGLPAEKRAALAAFNAAAANYQSVVLESFRNVADVLRALENDSERFTALSGADTASQKILDSTKRKYEFGAVSYYDLLNARQQRQQSKLDLAEGKAMRLINSVEFFQAMGGGTQ